MEKGGIVLNPRWYENNYDQDLNTWRKLDSAGSMLLEPQFKQLHYLLDRYYVSKSGYRLGPGFSTYQKIEILRKTMNELEKAIPYYEQKKVDDWHAQRDLEEDPNARSLREEEMEKVRREGSIRIISQLQPVKIDMGRYWINKYGQAFEVPDDIHHGEWIINQTDILGEKEKRMAMQLSSDVPAFLAYLITEGWVRVSGFVCEMYSDSQMPLLAAFLEDKNFPSNKEISVVHDQDGSLETVTIQEVISSFGRNSGGLESTGSVDRLHGGAADGMPDSKFDSKKLQEGADHEMEHTNDRGLAKEIAKDHLIEDPEYYEKVKQIEGSGVPNPLRQNYDYSNEMNGPEWQNRVRKYRDLIRSKKRPPHDKRERD
jgi:hypothetical protein